MNTNCNHIRHITANRKAVHARPEALRISRVSGFFFLLLLLFAIPFQSWARNGEIFIGEIDLGKIKFDEEVFDGDTAHIGFGVAYALSPNYELGFNYNYSFIFSASINGDPEIESVDDVETDARLLYLRRYWSIGKGSSLFAQLGYARTEVVSEQITSVCLIFCGSAIDVDTKTAYRSKNTGLAWGLGFEKFTSNESSVAISYVDYADSKFTGLHLSFRRYW